MALFSSLYQQESSLPKPSTQSDVSLEKALLHRRSIRAYQPRPLDLSILGQVLWAAQGITGNMGQRTAPSAGALYPMEILVATARIADLAAGIHHYLPHHHSLQQLQSGDLRPALAAAALEQECLHEAAAIVIVTAVPARTAVKYGRRAIRYVHMEAGHVAQNVCLQATALELGCVTVGAFDDDEIATVLNLPQGVEPLYLLPVGFPA